MLTETEQERAADWMILRDDAATQCVKILRFLFEEMPLETYILEAVARGDLKPELHHVLYGKGEASGLLRAEGLTIETALAAWKRATDELRQYGMIGTTLPGG